MVISKNKNAVILWSIIFRLLIEVVYVIFINKYYFQFSIKFNYEKYILSWIIFIISLLIINKIISRENIKNSIIITYLIYIMNYIPLISFWSLTDLSIKFFIYINIYWFFILSLILLYSKIKIRPKRVYFGRKISMLLLWGVFILASIFALIYSYKYNGLKIHIGLDDLYELRATAKEGNNSTLINLLYRWVSTVIFPLFALNFFIRKKWVTFVFVCYLQLLMFSVAGHKFYLFIIPVALVAYYFYNDRFLNYIPKWLSIFVLFSLFESLIFKTYYVADLFVRRLLYLPAKISYYYYDYFNYNEPVYFAYDMVLKRLGIIKTPYSEPVSIVIGAKYFNTTLDVNSNTGMFGDAYANLGFYAIIIFPVIFVLAMMLIDVITYNIPKKYLISIIISIVIFLINGELNGIFYNYIIPLTFILLFYDFKKNNGSLR